MGSDPAGGPGGGCVRGAEGRGGGLLMLHAVDDARRCEPEAHGGMVAML